MDVDVSEHPQQSQQECVVEQENMQIDISEKMFCTPSSNCHLAWITNDILSIILNFNHAEDNFRLFSCGQGLLNYNMKFHAWREFDAVFNMIKLRKQYEGSITYIRRWPRYVLSQLHVLKTISIKFIHSSSYSGRHRVPTFIFVLSDLEQLCRDISIENFSFIRLNLSAHEILEGLQQFSFSHFMPNLKSLCWLDNLNTLGKKNIESLPPTLTSLDTHKLDDDVTFRSLPRELETLRGLNDVDWNVICDGLHDMTCLTDLSMVVRKCTFVSHNLCELPASLTKLELHLIMHEYSSAYIGRFNRIQLLEPSYIPQSLIHLYLNGDVILSVDSLRYLPSTLLTLSVNFEELSSDCFQKLPERLETFLFWLYPTTTSSKQIVDDGILSALPRTLRSFVFTSAFSFTAIGVTKYLPPLLNLSRFVKRAQFLSRYPQIEIYKCDQPHQLSVSDKIINETTE